MSELFELILFLFSLLIPKRVQNWIMRQSGYSRIVLQSMFYALALLICVFICLLLFLAFAFVANTFFGGNFGIKDFKPSWVLNAIAYL